MKDGELLIAALDGFGYAARARSFLQHLSQRRPEMIGDTRRARTRGMNAIRLIQLGTPATPSRRKGTNATLFSRRDRQTPGETLRCIGRRKFGGASMPTSSTGSRVWRARSMMVCRFLFHWLTAPRSPSLGAECND
jgi:hypothetical protein